MSKEEAGHLSNGLPIATVDSDEKEIALIVPVGWKVTMLAAHSGCNLQITKVGVIDRTGDDPLAKVSFREIECVEKDPAPVLLEKED
jgi:hypothetical protein